MEQEVDKWSKNRPGDKPQSLWEELSAIGEEFVEFLEDSLGVKDAAQQQQSSSAGSNPAELYDKWSQKYGGDSTKSNR